MQTHFKTTSFKFLITLGLTAVLGTLSACADNPDKASSYPADTGVAASPAGVLGKQVWIANCQSCHGSLASKGAFPANVRGAINNNTGGMGSISVTQADLDNLAAFATNPIIY
jgi:mono/diheme cytochrome c family protein